MLIFPGSEPPPRPGNLENESPFGLERRSRFGGQAVAADGKPATLTPDPTAKRHVHRGVGKSWAGARP